MPFTQVPELSTKTQFDYRMRRFHARLKRPKLSERGLTGIRLRCSPSVLWHLRYAHYRSIATSFFISVRDRHIPTPMHLRSLPPLRFNIQDIWIEGSTKQLAINIQRACEPANHRIDNHVWDRHLYAFVKHEPEEERRQRRQPGTVVRDEGILPVVHSHGAISFGSPDDNRKSILRQDLSNTGN